MRESSLKGELGKLFLTTEQATDVDAMKMAWSRVEGHHTWLDQNCCCCGEPTAHKEGTNEEGCFVSR
jgi:hypothetical protein